MTTPKEVGLCLIIDGDHRQLEIHCVDADLHVDDLSGEVTAHISSHFAAHLLAWAMRVLPSADTVKG